MTTMFCLVSRQAMANVLPVFMLKPDQVLLLSTKEEKQCANNLEILFQKKKIKVYRKDNLDAYDYRAFRAVVKKELEKFNDDVILNITGGTKLMALAARDAFAELTRKIVYCDTEHKKLITIFPDYKIEELIADLTIEDYLSSYGYKIVSEKSVDSFKDYFKLFEFIEANDLLSSFVFMYKRFREKLNMQNMQKPRFSETNHNKTIIITRNIDTIIIEFGSSNRERFSVPHSEFRSGDWLEYYTFYLLDKQGNDQLKVGVKLINEAGIENEIDIIALKDHRLSLYSCKSGKRDNQYDLFQIETLRNITSGTFGKGFFVTPNQQSISFLQRAKELNIRVVNIFKDRSEL